MLADQIERHCPVPYRILESPYTSPDDGVLTFYIVNYQNTYARIRDPHTKTYTWYPMPRRDIQEWAPECVIVDESHHIGSPGALQSRMCHLYGKEARFRVFGTGTMFHRKPFYVFGAMKFYDDGKTFGTNFANFKRRIAVFGGKGGFEVKRYRNLKWMMREIRKSVYMVEHPVGVPPVDNILHFELTGKNLDAYTKMDRDSVLTLEDGETITAAIVLTRHLRLLQICGGFMRRENGKYVKVGSDKINMYSDRLREYMEQGIEKAVIGCRFLPELVAVARASQKLGYKVVLFHGGVPKGAERARRIEAFQTHDGPCVFVSQIAAGKEAIDLSVASAMLFYSLSESYVDHSQFAARIEQYKETRTLMYDFLIAEGTRDEVTYQALGRKMSVAKFIMTNPELVEKIATVEHHG